MTAAARSYPAPDPAPHVSALTWVSVFIRLLAIQGFQHINNRNRCRIARQDITAIDTLLRHEQSLSGQLLQHLSQQLGRNVVMICYLPGAHRLLGMLCQMLEPVKPFTDGV